MEADALGDRWQDFLNRRGLAGMPWLKSRLCGVTNETWLLTPQPPDRNHPYVLRHYTRTVGEDDLAFELSAVQFLDAQQFPVAAVIGADDGALFDYVDGRPCVLFRYVPGRVGANLSDTGSQDLHEGMTAARLLARMHVVTRRRQFPGSRQQRGDPAARLSWWMDNDGADPELLTVPEGPDFLARLSQLLERLTAAFGRDPLVWRGLVHGDVAPNNLVFDDHGQVAALLDFDDCSFSCVIFDLCSIIWAWGRSERGHLDSDRVQTLIHAYHSVRPLTRDEHELLPDLFAAYVAADATDKITWWWRGEQRPRPVSESHAARVFLQTVTSASTHSIFGKYP